MSDSLAETVCRDIDAAREELIGLCGRLVAATSVNPPGRTVEAAEVVRAYLSGHGVATETITAADEAPIVIGRIESGAGRRHVVFNAHVGAMAAGDAGAWAAPIAGIARRVCRL